MSKSVQLLIKNCRYLLGVRVTHDPPSFGKPFPLPIELNSRWFFIYYLHILKVTKLWSPDGGTEASTTRRSNNPESLSSTDKNAANMITENSQLKKQLAQVT